MDARKSRLLLLLGIGWMGIGLIQASAAAPPSRSLEESLQFAGENREQLEEALRLVPGSDTELLIRYASQYDLVNLSAEILRDNVTLARKVRFAPYLKGTVSEAVWQEYVLPYRVLYEDLENWRPELYDMLHPMVKDAANTKEAARIILEWMWQIEDDGSRKVRFRGGENRHKTPLQILEYSNATCRGLNQLYVAFLRAVGIPARHCTMALHFTKSGTHYFCEYWDSEKGDWESWDASDNLSIRGEHPRTRFETGKWNTLVCYAHPGLWTGPRDLYADRLWEYFAPITGRLYDTFELEVQSKGEGPFTAAIHIFNMRAWRVAAYLRSEEGEPVTFELIRTVKKEPILVSVANSEGFGWEFFEIVEGKNLVRLDPTQERDSGLNIDAVPASLDTVATSASQ